jgi:hypothetical protein
MGAAGLVPIHSGQPYLHSQPCAARDPTPRYCVSEYVRVLQQFDTKIFVILGLYPFLRATQPPQTSGLPPAYDLKILRCKRQV